MPAGFPCWLLLVWDQKKGTPTTTKMGRCLTRRWPQVLQKTEVRLIFMAIDQQKQPVATSPRHQTSPTPPRDDSISSEEQLPPAYPVNTPLESTGPVYSPMECVDADNTPCEDPALHSHELGDTHSTPDKRPAPMSSSNLNQPPLQQEDTDEAAGQGGPSSTPKTGSRSQAKAPEGSSTPASGEAP